MAKFKPGETKKGGRKSGTKNRTTEQFRELIKNFVENNWKGLQKDFEQVKPVERLQFINSMLRHFLPDPLSLEKLSESQLSQLHEYLLKKYSDEQAK
jgi:hypothetical protein